MSFLLQQPNFKQKFVALLKRFKVTDEVSAKNIDKIVIIGLRSERQHLEKMLNVKGKASAGSFACRHGVDHEARLLGKLPSWQKDASAARAVSTMYRRVAAMCS